MLGLPTGMNVFANKQSLSKCTQPERLDVDTCTVKRPEMDTHKSLTQ